MFTEALAEDKYAGYYELNSSGKAKLIELLQGTEFIYDDVPIQ